MNGRTDKGRGGEEEEALQSVEERYTEWKSLIPVLYDWLANHNLTDGSCPNTLVIANCEIVKPRVAAALHISQFNEESRSPFVKMFKTIIHPGESPQNFNVYKCPYFKACRNINLMKLKDES
ncbi:hypothetical protein FXO38_18514 [Capsicum annuum]|nr:hypothetical protein FXO38_18514 [Capsicum annuum]KAF3655190.1 hypothetical protein FXO37_16078 [Capsicum annuum]